MEISDILNRQKTELKTKKWDNKSAINCFLGDGQPRAYEAWEAAGKWLALQGPEPFKSYARKALKIPRGPAQILQFPTIIPTNKPPGHQSL